MLTFVNDKGTRRIVKISVSGAGKDALTKVSDRYGMKEYIVGGRVYEWFMRQDDLFQRAVLGLLNGLEVDAARVFMERLGRGEPVIPAGRTKFDVFMGEVPPTSRLPESDAPAAPKERRQRQGEPAPADPAPRRGRAK